VAAAVERVARLLGCGHRPDLHHHLQELLDDARPRRACRPDEPDIDRPSAPASRSAPFPSGARCWCPCLGRDHGHVVALAMTRSFSIFRSGTRPRNP
jgi:hypothetical protein